MSIPTTSHDFLIILRSSKLLEEDALDRYLIGLENLEGMTAIKLARKMLQDGLLTSFQADHLLKGRYKNFFIGKYKVLRPLGSGGMSQVFLCEHVVMRHWVALKLLHVSEGNDPSAISRFVREARAAASVNHPNVVRAHDFDQAEGKYHYIVMDYVDGVNLHELVKKLGPLPPEQAANYISQTARGLQHISDCGLIHRDLKPSNLLLDRAGAIRILDLGLVRYAHEGTNENLTRNLSGNTIIGTADYLAPEQALQSESIDIRADIYSLGATFYFLLTGRAPFDDRTIAQKLLGHQFQNPDPPEGVPEPILDVLRTMMRKSPEDRYTHPEDVVEALAPFLPDPPEPPSDDYFPTLSIYGSGPATGGPRSQGPNSNKKPSSRILLDSNLLGSSRARPQTQKSGRMTAPPMPDDALPERIDIKKWILIGAAAMTLTVIAAVLVALYANPFSAPKNVATKPEATQATPTPTRPSVPVPAGSLVVGPGGQYQSVRDALSNAKSGDRILIVATEHTESLEITDIPPRVTIQGWPENAPIRWRSASVDKPAIRIENVVGLTVSHIAFLGETGTAVELKGQVAGFRFANSSIEGFRTALRLNDCVANVASPLVLNKLRFLTAKEAQGILLLGTAKHVRVEECRWEGPFAPAVELGGELNDVAITSNRFSGSSQAIVYTNFAAKSPVRIRNNAFATCQVGVMFQALPINPATFEIANNLFFKMNSIAKYMGAEDRTIGRAGAVWLWHDEGRDALSETNVPACTRRFRRSFDLKEIPSGEVTLDIGCVTAFKVWLNGTLVGESTPKYFTRRVFAFPVRALLKPGNNAIAVEASHSLDPINSGFAVAAGLTVRLSTAGLQSVPIVATDANWKSIDTAVGDWRTPTYDDSKWKMAKVWDKQGYVFPWTGAVWDSVVNEQFQVLSNAGLNANGNVRDYTSSDGFPLLNSLRGYIPKLAGDDPTDDATYLRTPRAIRSLFTVGENGQPVGLPAER